MCKAPAVRVAPRKGLGSCDSLSRGGGLQTRVVAHRLCFGVLLLEVEAVVRGLLRDGRLLRRGPLYWVGHCANTAIALINL